MNIRLGKKWKAARIPTGLTQEAVCEKINLGPRYISDLERDITIGSIPVLINLCNLYNVTPTIILQDYLNIKDDLKLPVELTKFKELNKRDQSLIISLINEMLRKAE